MIVPCGKGLSARVGYRFSRVLRNLNAHFPPISAIIECTPPDRNSGGESLPGGEAPAEPRNKVTEVCRELRRRKAGYANSVVFISIRILMLGR